MAAILASQSCCCRNIDLLNQGSSGENISFANSVSNPVAKLEKRKWSLNLDYNSRFRVEMQKTETPSSKLGSNGRPIKMVPTSEVMNRRAPNGNRVDMVNGKKQVINGTSVVKRDSKVALVKSPRYRHTDTLPPLEDLKALPTDEGFSWASENYNSVQRTIDVWSFVLEFRVRVLFDNSKWTYPGGFTEDKQKMRRRKTASWLREKVLQLGATFIKVGQLSSTRSDLFPQEYVDELAKLQDRVPAFSPEKAKSFTESELGAPINVLFRVFEERPIAAASLGQVHRAILHNGEKVAVKIQRPGLRRLFDIDLRNIFIQ